MSTDLHIGRGFRMPVDVVTEAVGIVATRGAGKSYLSAVVIEETHAAGVPFVVLDPNGVYWGLRSNAAGVGPGLPVYVLGGPHGDLPLEPGAGKLIADVVADSGHSFVLDLSDLPTKAAARGFVADFLERLHRAKARNRSTLLLVVDEADEFAPQNPRGETARSLGAMETIAKRGRAFGLGIVMITQRTQALNKDVLDLIETLFAMRQLSERSRAAVKGWIADKDLRDELGVIESLPSLPTGTAWAWSPVREVLERVAVRRIRTFDSYATPKPGEARVEPTARTEIDLDALGAQMQATVERARENDPADLRRRIRELETELDERPNVPPEMVEVRIETPVFPPALRDAILREYETLASTVALAKDGIDEALQRARTNLEADWGLAMEIAEASEPTATRGGVIEPSQIAAAARKIDRGQERIRTLAPPRASSRLVEPGPASYSANGDARDAIPAPQRRILDAIAWWDTIGVYEPAVSQVAFVVGNHPRSKGFTNNISALSAGGKIERGTGTVRLTAAGSEAAHRPAMRPTSHDLQQMIYQQVGAKRAEILRYLIEEGRDVSMDELAEGMGYHPRSKGFTNNVSSLSGLGLIDRSPGFVRASRLCYVGGA